LGSSLAGRSLLSASRGSLIAVSERERRVGMNESVFREVNEQIEELAEELDARTIEFVCECCDPACSERVSASLDAYEAVRSHADRFLLLPGHQRPELE